MLSRLTDPRYPNAGLGIESDSITAVSLASAGRQRFSIRQAASVEVPAGLITPNFLERNIADGAEFTSCLREAAENAGLLRQARWSVTLPSGTARTAILALETEPTSKQEAAEILNWKAEQSFGVPAADLRLARQRISPDREGRSRYFASAVSLAVIDEYETHFDSLGWKAGLILPRAVGEANWLMRRKEQNDSLLISANRDGFTALLLRGSEPAVVRSVTCGPEEVDDEIYRLVMFYSDRFGKEPQKGLLERLLVVGRGLVPGKIQQIASEALGRNIQVMSPDEVGLALPGGGLSFDDLAAPAGVAALGF